MKKRLSRLLKLGIFVAGIIYSINKLIEYYANKKGLIATDKGQFYDWKHGSIFYTVKGNGSPVLLVHDLNAISSGYEWSRLIRYLAKDHTVYTIDLLGCGRSDKPAITYTSFLFTEMLHDFASDIIGEKTTVIATGGSTSFTITASTLYPDSFDKTIIINPEPLSESTKTPDSTSKLVKFMIQTPLLGTYIYNIETGKKNITRLFHQMYFLKDSDQLNTCRDAYFEAAHKNHADGKYLLSSMRGHYMNTNLKLSLRKAENLYFIGSRDRNHSVSIIDEYANYNAKIETTYVSGSKYLPQLESPSKLFSSLSLFM